MPKKKSKPAIAWYLEEDRDPIYETGDDQEIIQIFSELLGHDGAAEFKEFDY